MKVTLKTFLYIKILILTFFMTSIWGGNFRGKARIVADGNMNEPPSLVTYTFVVSRYSVRVCLLLTSLNGLDIQADDIENAYITSSCREKLWTIVRNEFSSNQGKPFNIVAVLYGPKI